MSQSLVTIAGVIIGIAIGPLLAQMATRVFSEEPISLLPPGGIVGAWRLGVVDAAPPQRRRSLLMAAAAGTLVGLTAAVIGPLWVLPAYLWFTAVTLLLTLTDLDRKLIPNRILYPATVVGAVLLVSGGLLDGEGNAIVRAGLGALAYFSVLFLLALIAGGGFGFGDVKLGFFLGMFLAYLSWGTLIVGGVGAFLLGGLVGLLLILLRIKSRKDKIPFGPYLVAGAYLAMAFAPEIVDWYLS